MTRTAADEQLIRWVADGDNSCLAALFERHHLGVYRYCRRMTRNPAQSEDLVQDVFLKVLRNAGSFRGDGSFKGWLYNIARNAAFDFLNRARRQDTDPLDEEAVPRQLTDDRSAERAAAGSQKFQLVLRALARLPVAVQEVIWLGRFEFDNYEELGQALDCKPGTARVRMHRAMTLLHATCTELNGASNDV